MQQYDVLEVQLWLRSVDNSRDDSHYTYRVFQKKLGLTLKFYRERFDPTGQRKPSARQLSTCSRINHRYSLNERHLEGMRDTLAYYR